MKLNSDGGVKTFLKATGNDKYRQIDSSTIDGNVEILHSVQLYRSS